MIKTIPGWELCVDRGPDWLLVKVKRPSSVRDDGPSLADALWLLMEQHCTHRLVLELDQIRSLDEQLVEELVDLHDRICSRGGLMRIAGCRLRNRQLLSDRRLHERFVPYADREGAVLGGGDPAIRVSWSGRWHAVTRRSCGLACRFGEKHADPARTRRDGMPPNWRNYVQLTSSSLAIS